MTIVSDDREQQLGGAAIWKTAYRVLIITVLLSTGLARPGYAASGPMDQVRTSVDAIIGLMQTKELEISDKREKIRNIIASRFDFRLMAQRTLAVNWKKATDDEKKRFVELFTRLLQATYMGRIEAYSDEKVEYLSERIKGKQALVDTVVTGNSTKIPVSYKLRDKSGNGSWWVYDVVVEKVSLTSSYRSEFRELVKSKGISGLLDQLEEKLHSLEQVSTT